MNVAVFGKKVTKQNAPYYLEFLKKLKEFGWNPVFHSELKEKLVKKIGISEQCDEFSSHHDFQTGIDLSFSMGGDGTFIQNVKFVRDSNVPVLGINMGRLGFLSTVPKDAIEKAMHHSAINLIGKTSLKQLTAILKEASIVLAPDSGPAHIATTQNTPVIGLYGHSNPLRTRPYLSPESVISVYEKHVQEQHKKPLAELPWSARAKGNHIMQDISIEQVIKMFDRLIINL